jgi:hypothetical protein
VQRVKTRTCHQLAYAESTLYTAAKYLGSAERVRRDLSEERLSVPASAREEFASLLRHVRHFLEGGGYGIPNEQQEYIGETVLRPDGRVISNIEFRDRVFEMPGWESLVGLLRFFVHANKKAEYEIADSVVALRVLEDRLDELSQCQSLKDYKALSRRFTGMLDPRLALRYAERGTPPTKDDAVGAALVSQ